MSELTLDKKRIIKEKINKLKSESGTHSPSIATLINVDEGLDIKVDACFLSNPYATDLFMSYLNEELITKASLRNVLEYYPPQNREVAKYISNAIKIDPKNIFIGNGAIEIIQAILHNFVKKKICIIIPTFSSYYEFVKQDKEVIFFKLKKENNYILNYKEYLNFIKSHKPDTIVIINPNNPNGGYLSKSDLENLLIKLDFVENFIVDESFIHFAYEDADLFQITSEELIRQYKNLIIIKSMSKDFGIAGIRAGYAVMNQSKVEKLLSSGYLWNVSGLANYFFCLYGNNKFQQEYDVVRKKYIMNTLMFLSELNSIAGIKAYPSRANFALIELISIGTSFDFATDLLIDHGVYVRDCSDKKGLDGEYIRVASRTFEENLQIISSIKSIIANRHS